MRSWLAVAGCLGVLGTADMAAAQQPTIVRSNVVDENAAPVVGASITFHDADNDWTYTSESDKKGAFVIAVRRGVYVVTVEKEGFRGAQSQYRIDQRDGMEIPTVTIVSAKSILDDALRDLNRRFEKAAELVAADKLDEAQAVYEALLAERPEVAEVHYNLGLLLARKGEQELSAGALEKALELRPDHAPAALALAGIYEEIGRGDEAVAMMERVATQFAEDAEIQVAAAHFHLGGERRENARPYLERALALDPDNADAHYLLATVAAGEGEIDEAVRLLERFLELAGPDDRHRPAAERFLPELKGHVTRDEAGE